ncbi:MAG: hypothetical protein KKE23_02205 [Nanoarchaeota archaeon]|nr:hypothetical protein [Nanoarchaeota archaeon]
MESHNYKTFEEVTLLRKISEMNTLRNRIVRYQKKLVFEGLKKNDPKEDFDINSLDSKLIGSEEYSDVTSIVELAKDDYPSLYRRFHQSIFKFKKGYGLIDKLE